MKNKLYKLFLKALLLYATLFPSSGLINEMEDYSTQPEDIDEHMFI